MKFRKSEIAESIFYDNTTSSLTATNVQAAIDENVVAIAALDWADVLGVDNASGANNALMSNATEMQFRASTQKIFSAAVGAIKIDASGTSLELASGRIKLSDNLILIFDSGTFETEFTSNGTLTAARALFLPDANGILAVSPNNDGSIDLADVLTLDNATNGNNIIIDTLDSLAFINTSNEFTSSSAGVVQGNFVTSFTFDTGSFFLKTGVSNFVGELELDSLTANRIFSFPNFTGNLIVSEGSLGNNENTESAGWVDGEGTNYGLHAANDDWEGQINYNAFSNTFRIIGRAEEDTETVNGTNVLLQAGAQIDSDGGDGGDIILECGTSDAGTAGELQLRDTSDAWYIFRFGSFFPISSGKDLGGSAVANHWDILFVNEVQFTSNETINDSSGSLNSSALTSHLFNVGGSLEVSIAANTMTFNSGATDPILNWATDGTLALTTGVWQTDNAITVKTTRFTSGPQTLDGTHHNVFCDTDGGAFTINLPAGVKGREYRIINTGSSGNDITIAPNGAELLAGVNASVPLVDGNVLVLVFNTTEGWW